MVGSGSGQLTMWSLKGEGCPPIVSQEAGLELDGAVFSLTFDQQMNLVREREREE